MRLCAGGEGGGCGVYGRVGINGAERGGRPAKTEVSGIPGGAFLHLLILKAPPTIPLSYKVTRIGSLVIRMQQLLLLTKLQLAVSHCLKLVPPQQTCLCWVHALTGRHSCCHSWRVRQTSAICRGCHDQHASTRIPVTKPI